MQEVNLGQAEESPIAKILDSARDGSWVLVCPIQFPQYFVKLGARLKELEEAGACSRDFRLFFDL